MTIMTKADFQSKMDVSRETQDSLEVYAALLEKWQPAKNLVSNSTIADMWRRHFLDSAQMYEPITQIHGVGPFTFMDIGSGAGFPGLVLSMMGLGEAHMVESNHKKCIFMNQVVRQTIANAQIHNERIEKLADFKVNFIVSRACATITQLLDWSADFIRPETEMWLLKGAIADHELTDALKSWNMQSEQFQSKSDESGRIVRLFNIAKK